MGKAQNAATLGVHVSKEIIDVIERRARHRGITKSRFAALILEEWYKRKCPAIDTIDSTARALVKEEMDHERSVQNNPRHVSLKKFSEAKEGSPFRERIAQEEVERRKRESAVRRQGKPHGRQSA